MIELYWVSQYKSMLDIMIKTINSINIIFIKNKEFIDHQSGGGYYILYPPPFYNAPNCKPYNIGPTWMNTITVMTDKAESNR